MTENDAKSSDGEWICERGERGRFTKTNGRPVGTRNKASQASVKAISSLADLAFQQLRTLLESGHPETVRFVVSNLIPAGGRAIELDDLSTDGLIQAVASGTIRPVEMKNLASAVEKIRNVESLDKLSARLAELESLLKNGSVQ